MEALGTELAASLSAVVAAVPSHPVGPQALGRALDTTTVTASRLLKALGQTDPIHVLQLVPGPNPLRKLTEKARAIGTDKAACQAALKAVTSFEHLIRNEAGDRGSLRAMLSAWLPEDRREFEAQRRQTAYKALHELEGISCELHLSTFFLRPTGTPNKVDIVSVQGLFGIDRIRPDAVVKVGTRRLERPSATSEPPRLPQTLGGKPALDGLDAVRLDEFCNAPPAPLTAREFGTQVEYSLGPTGFGRGSKVDLLVAEYNPGETVQCDPTKGHAAHFFVAPEMPTRKVVFDLLVHEDIFKQSDVEVLAYNMAAQGPAGAYDPERELDRRECPEPLQELGRGTDRARIMEFPRYTALLEHVGQQLGWDLTPFRVLRLSMSYPLLGQQLTIAFS